MATPETVSSISESYFYSANASTTPVAVSEWMITFRLVINGFLLNFIIVAGLIANALTLVVLTRPSMRTSTNSFLSSLAIWDSAILVCSALLLGIPGLPASWPWTNSYRDYGPYAFAVSYIYPLGLIAQTATVWLTVSFTIERYIGVHYPLKAVALCTVQRARLVITVVCLLSVIYNISRWFEYRPVTDQLEGRVAPEDQTNETYRRVYFLWFYLPVMCIVPLVLLAVINTSLYLAVRRSRANRKQMNVQQARENNITVVLVAVVAVFIVCQVPALIYNVAYAINTTYTLHSPMYQALSEVRNLLVNVNSAINFLLYCVFGQKFRRVFMATFCGRFEKSVMLASSARYNGAPSGTGSRMTHDDVDSIPLSQRGNDGNSTIIRGQSWRGRCQVPGRKTDKEYLSSFSDTAFV